MTDHLMPDLTPNDLSHLSDGEFHALCPQGEHAPGPEPLSPAARDIVAAFDDRYELIGPLDGNWQEVCVAGALRALAMRINGAGDIRDVSGISGGRGALALCSRSTARALA